MTTARDSCGASSAGWRRFGLVVLALVSFWATAVLVRAVQSPYRGVTRGARLEAFLAQKDEIDALFVGSSRIQRGVSPVVIDRRLGSPDRPFRSFNLGIPGMRSFEGDWLIRRILESKPERLRFLIVEAPRFDPEPWSVVQSTERYVDWHDATSTKMVLRALWRSDMSLSAKLWESGERLYFFVLRASNYATSSRFGSGPTPVWDEIVGGWSRQQGFRALDKNIQGVRRRRRRFLRTTGQFERSVAALTRSAEDGELAKPDWARTYDVDSLIEQIERIEAAGIVPVYLATPQLTRGPDFEALRDEGVVDHFVDLRDPREHPEFFALEYRFDREHMNADGAQLLSEAIAERLAPVVDETPREGTR